MSISAYEDSREDALNAGNGRPVKTETKRPRFVRCPHGGPAPCIDDLCHGSDTTLCGLERGFDFCDHGYDPDECPDCSGEDDDFYTDREDEVE